MNYPTNMKIEIKATSDGVGYASKTPYEYEGKSYEPDIQDGDWVTIKDEGVVEEGGKFGDQIYFKIETRNGIKKAPFNQSSLNVLAKEIGSESAEWIGKKVKVLTQKAIIANERRLKVFYVTEGWFIDDWGDLVQTVVIDHTVKPLDPSDPSEANVPDEFPIPPRAERAYPEYPGAPTV